MNHRVEAIVDLALACRADLVVASFELQARITELDADVVAQVSVLIDRAHGEVAALERSLVGKISAFLDTIRVPGALV